MFAYKRLEQLFLRFNTESICTMNELTKYFAVSERTIRSDIKELNNELVDYNAEIVTLRGIGYQLQNKENVRILFQQMTDKSSSTAIFSLENTEDRIKQLLYLLLTAEKFLSIDELCDTIFVGRTTLLGYLKELKVLLASYELVITSKTNIGYKLTGQEINVRQCFAEQMIERNLNSYISQFSIIEQRIFAGIDLKEIFQKTIELFPPHEYKITDYNRKNFIVHIAIAILRIKKHHEVEELTQVTLFDPKIQQAMDQLIEWVESNHQLTFCQNDKNWVYAHFFTELQQQSSSKQYETEIEKLVQELLKEIKQTFGENLQADETLKKDLIVHFSNYLPLKNILTIKSNPLLPAIKRNYSYAFELTVMAISKNKFLHHYQFTEDDIGYIALHIAAAIERSNKKELKTKKVLIVCGQGISSSRLLEAIVHKNFPEQIEIIDTVSFATFQLQEHTTVDFIISTIPLAKTEVPIVQVDFMEIKKGLQEIQQLLDQDKKRSELYTLFDPSLFFINTEMDKREQLIHTLGNILEKKHVITKNFIEKVITRERVVPTNITHFIAIPHAIDSQVKETKIMVCISKVAIKWDKENSVKIIFLIIGKDNDKEGLQTFFDYLSDLVENEKLQKKMTQVNQFSELIDCLSNISK
ncbi:BglG family transcription antiterminator [Tetragenococcus halophilus]|uniref:BglG family transcription antiterminator n=1 Tax=Tetragenococcus halophilus TaxID=51669 RepID=UPI002A9F7333|nr:BglG family transcription antiterminator [Tetragenococcus halophilus]